MKLGSRKVLAGLALALVSSVAVAAVTFDIETGTGFVGKGDVQTVFGYNNAVMQARHQNITFSYRDMEIISQDCVDIDGGPGGAVFTVVGHRTKSTGISGVVASDSRKTGQWTGWMLNGWNGGTSVTETIWTTADGTPGPSGCPVGSNPHGPVQRLESAGAGLYATDPASTGDQTRLIWTATP